MKIQVDQVAKPQTVAAVYLCIGMDGTTNGADPIMEVRA